MTRHHYGARIRRPQNEWRKNIDCTEYKRLEECETQQGNGGEYYYEDQPDPPHCGRDDESPGGDTGEWPDPDLSILEHQLLAPPKLPLDLFGTYWSAWITAQAEEKGCPPDYVAGSLLSGSGALIGNARWGSPWDEWAEPTIIWHAGVGHSSSGKSPGLDAVRDLIAAIETAANEGYKDKLKAWDTAKRVAKITLDVWEDECKKTLKNKTAANPPMRPDGANEPPRPARKRIITNDPTVEKVARVVLENPKGLMLFRDELSGWIGSLDKYGGAGGDRAFYLESYGGRAYAVDRVKDSEPIVVPALSICITGGIQPDRLVTLVFSGDDDGLAARIFYVWAERIPPRRPTGTAPLTAQSKLTKLYDLEMAADGGRIILKFDKEAATALQEYRTQVAEKETGTSGLYHSWLGKLPGMAVRFATVFEHLYWIGDNEKDQAPTSISEEAAVAAIAFLDKYAAPMARRCFGEAALPQVDRDARVLARWIKAQLAGDPSRHLSGANGPIGPKTSSVNARNLRHAGALNTKEAARYDVALVELEAAGWVRQHPSRTGDRSGRQRKDWELNPKLMGAILND